MKAEIITIGDEILIGQIVDSNSAFIGAELNKIGISVYQITSVQDEKQHILNALQEAADRVDIVIATGGLGPTKDDITKTTFCEFFDDVLVENKAVLAQVVALFEKVYQKPITSLNKTQALLPSKATILNNDFGTAAGMWMKQNGTIFISLKIETVLNRARSTIIWRSISAIRTCSIELITYSFCTLCKDFIIIICRKRWSAASMS